jgi:hypothetical protein
VKLRISIIVAFLTITFLCMGFAAALNQDEASVHSFFSTSTLTPGQTVTVTVFFTSNSTDALQVTAVGLHFDWMSDASGFYGFDLTSQPVTVAAGGTQAFPQMTIQIPTNVTLGEHTYFVGVDGTQGSSATDFSWSSPTLTVLVVGSNGQTAGPTVTTAPTADGGKGGLSDMLLYGVAAVIVIIVVLLVIVLMLRRRKPAKPKPAINEGATQPETPSQPPKSNPEQDFNI